LRDKVLSDVGPGVTIRAADVFEIMVGGLERACGKRDAAATLPAEGADPAERAKLDTGRRLPRLPASVQPRTRRTSWTAPSSASGKLSGRSSTATPSSVAERMPRDAPSGFSTAIS